MLEWPSLPDLPALLRRMLDRIPPGRVTTYGALAAALGDRRAARWVGEFLMDHPHDADCPCHRVVRQGGDPGLYIAGGDEAKRARLRSEGVQFQNGMVDLPRFEVPDSVLSKAIAAEANESRPGPLAELQQFQEHVRAATELTSWKETPATVGAVDVAYDSSGQGVAALVIVETATGRSVHSATARNPVRFPYISSYLSFREAELLRPLLEQTVPLPGVMFVDGNGRLHPRRAGIATMLGVLTGVRTIGIGKSLLCGSVDLEGLKVGEWRPILDSGELLGAAVRGNDRFHPVYVSPGHRLDLEAAVRLTLKTFHGHRLPEPVFLADQLSKVAARS